MKLVLKILSGFVGVLVWGALLQVAFNFINAADDVQLYTGVAFLIVLLGIALFTLIKAGKMIYKPLAKFIATLVLLFAVVGSTTGCYDVVAPGHVGIKVNRYGQGRGVADYPIRTGMVWYNPFSTSVIEYPVFMQTASWTSNPHEGNAQNEEISFNSKEGLSISADVSLSYQLNADKASHFYVKFRADNIDNFTHGFLRNVARDAFTEEAAHYTAEELYGLKKEEFLTHVRARVNSQVDSLGITVEQLGFIGLMRLPPNVVDALNAKVKAIQDASTAENQLRTAQANAAIRVAGADGEAKARVAAAQGDAQANRLLQASLTPQLIEWRRLNLQEQAINKWDGTLPTYNGGGAVPFVNIPAPERQQ